MRLRDYQESNIAEIRQHLAAGRRSVLWQLPTGGGKTAGAAYMAGTAASRGKRVWFVCHRRELLRQSSLAFTESGIHHAMIAAGMPYDGRHKVQICGIDTLRRRPDKVHAPDVIIWDECHHISAASWASVFEYYPRCRNVGLSATPERLDGNGLGRFFDELVVGPSTASLIRDGYLSPYRLFAPQAGDFNRKEINAVMDKPKVVGDAVTHYLKIANGRPTLLFAPSVKFSKEAAARFRDAGVPAMHVDANTDPIVRDSAIKDLERGAIKVLCNVDLFGEGVSVNNVACVIQMRPTQSLALYLQQVGRGLRTFPGKEDCIILDHAGNSAQHGMPDDERQWSLAGRDRKAKVSDPDDLPVKQCPQCYAINRALAQSCRECGKVFVVKARVIKQVEGELAEVDVDAMRAQQRVLQGNAKDREALAAVFDGNTARADHVLAARAEKEQLRSAAMQAADDCYRGAGGQRMHAGLIRALKPKQLKELIVACMEQLHEAALAMDERRAA